MARDILGLYKGDIPFAAWLKNFFKQNKKYGSRDRKFITNLCFCFFRLGDAFKSLTEEDRLLIGQFLCQQKSVFVEELKPAWQEKMSWPIQEKLKFLDVGAIDGFFPFATEISSEIKLDTFQSSFLQQPDLFLRIRPGKNEMVVQQLEKAGIAFSLNGACVRLSNSTKVDDVLRMDEEVVVQDISSQCVLESLQLQTLNPKHQIHFWDCCAASGGKTILFYDAYPKSKITVSDVRESILVNLKNRLKRAGIYGYKSFVADVSAPHFSLPQKFDVILCDAPCSGSGTWGRTPEQLVFFKKEKIDYYSSLQKSIALNASRSLRQNGFFLYVTCSVFRKENEEVVEFLERNSQLKLESQQYFNGYDKKGDTLFTALFTA